MLQFIGCGSAFNTALGNNGAFINKDRKLFMIDCGSSTFERLQRAGVLADVDEVHILMTHTHPDHIGSLGDLIFYGYYVMGEFSKPSIHVYAPEKLPVLDVLRPMGVKQEQFVFHQFDSEVSIIDHEIQAIPVNHSSMVAYGYLIKNNDETIYYSGDCSEIPSEILSKLEEIDCFYQDTSKLDYPGNPHMSLRQLTETIPEEQRGKVYCMHLDNEFDRDEAEALGFNVVESIL